MLLTLKTENYILLQTPEIRSLAERLKVCAEDWESAARPARIGSGSSSHLGPNSGPQLHTEIRGDFIHWLELGQSPELDQQLASWLKSLNETLYLGLTDWECHFAAYPAGTRYQRHVDQGPRTLPGRTSQSRQAAFERVVSFVIYLNSDWQEQDGGQLLIYSEANDHVGISIQPLLGNAVMFLSSDVEHEVAVAKTKRWSLTGWFLRPTLKDA